MTGGRESICGIILAGGQSRRMGGREKGLIELAGVPMIAHVRNRLAPQVARLVISANGDPSRFARFCLPVIADTVENAGPLAGILAGMHWTAETQPEATHVLTAAADTPFLPHDLAARLAGAAPSPNTIMLPQTLGGTHQAMGLWPLSLAGDLAAFLAEGGDRKLMTFIRRHSWQAVGFQTELTDGQHFDPFFNINTPADLETAEAMIDGR